jgi:hypothetical protein
MANSINRFRKGPMAFPRYPASFSQLFFASGMFFDMFEDNP